MSDKALPETKGLVETSHNNIAEIPLSTSAVVTTNDSPLMQIIERIAEMPELDLDRVDRLFLMHEKMLNREAEAAFNESMARAQMEIQSVVVNKANDHTKSGYADLSAIHEKAKPVWAGCGFSVITRSMASDKDNHIRIHTEVRHCAGHKEVYNDDWPLDIAGAKGNANKTAIQAKGSSITYARRYSELMIFDIAIKGEDNDGNAPAKGNELSSTATDWIDVISQCGDIKALQGQFQDAYKHLNGDPFGRNQLIKAKDIRKQQLQAGS